MFISMLGSRFIALFVLSLSLICTCTRAEPLNHVCFGSDFSASSPYKNNLNNVLSLLISQVPPTGFGKGYKTQNKLVTYGLGMCRGDVSTSACKDCVTYAGRDIKEQCPSSKGAIIWYDNCMVKYSDEQFFGVIDSTNQFTLANTEDIDMDFATFYSKTKQLLSGLTNKAVGGPRRYASGEQKLAGPKQRTIFGLVQCTQDLTAADCRKCLNDAINGLPACCNGKRGGRVVGGSCNVRYELYPFTDV